MFERFKIKPSLPLLNMFANRIQCLKKNWNDKILTVNNIEELDVMDVCKLKKNLWYVEISLKLDSHTNDEKKALECLRDEMTTLVMSSHVFKRVTQLSSTPEDEVTELERESLRVMRNWLFFLVNMGLKTTYTSTHATASTLLQQIDDVINEAEKDSEVCIICGAHVEGIDDISTSICIQGHSVPRCFLSMVQCGVLPYYSCPVCKVIAHPSAVSLSSSTCVFCDNYLRLDEKVNREDDLTKSKTLFFGQNC